MAKKPEVAMGNPDWIASYSGKQPENKAAEPAAEEPTKGNEQPMKKAKLSATRTKKPRAAKNPKQARTKKTSASSAQRYDKIMEHSICSVVRRLGMEDVKPDHARAILAKHGITMPEASLRVQLGYGRTGKRGVAELTKDQVKELITSAAPEPVAA